MRLLLVLIFLSGCVSMPDNIRERNYIASFKTSLSAEDLVICMNANSRTFIPIIYAPPTKYTETTEVIYSLSHAGTHSALYEDGVVELYTESVPDIWDAFQKDAEHYQNFCG